MRGVVSVVVAAAERVEPVVRHHLPRFVAGLVVFGLAAAYVPHPGSAAGAPAPTLVGAVSSASTFLGATEPGRAGVEASALALTTSLGGLPVEPGHLGPWVRSGGALVSADRCPPADLTVSWRPPAGDHRLGAYVEPLGPPPTSATTAVNGVVTCRTSPYAILGFEAVYSSGRWRLAAVPSLAAESGAEPLLAGEAEAAGATPAETGMDANGDGGSALPPAAAWGATPLEPLAPYVPQLGCDPVAKPGVLGFRDLVLTTFPGTRNLGIGRACEAEGVSEHKEGRAFDWGVHADDPTERAAVDAVLAWLLGPDEATGEPFAIARRLGVMYVIWDGQIWSAFRAVDGWRPYVGVSEHRDHVHLSFDWAGALAQTSFWRGGGVSVRAGSDLPDLPLAPVARASSGPGPGAVLPPIPLPFGLTVPPPPSESDGGGGADQGEAPTTTTSSTTTTTAPPPTTTTTSAPPPSTTTSTAPPPTILPPPPTTIRLGGL